MKKLLSFCLLLLCVYVATQAQNTLPFQGVVRDTNGTLIPNQNMSVRITILSGSASGTSVYQETQSVTTNNLGLFTLSIGGGTVVSGTFGSISWGSAPMFVLLEVDPTGGTNYINMGTSQLQSVPYALYALNGGGGSAAQPSSQVVYGTGSTVTSDGGFTRNEASQQTIITDNFGTQGATKLRVDSAKILITYSDYASGDAAGFFSGPAYPDWNLNSICVASVVYDQANQIKYGYYAVADSSQMITGATIGGAVVGTKLYSAYMDVAMYENPNSPFNSLTVDTNGLHWEYGDTDRFTFPNEDGSAGQVMTTNGAGILSFTNLPAPTPNAWNAHQVLPGNGTVTDTITLQNNKNNIYNPASSVTSLSIILPASPNDGDMFILTFEGAVSSITYQNGTTGNGALTSATATQQKTYTYDAANSTWF